MTMISIIKPAINVKRPLYHKYPAQSSPQPAYIELNCESGLLTGNWNGEIGNAVPFSVYHGHHRRWEVSASISSESLTELLYKLASIAQRIVDGYEDVWDGRNRVAQLDSDAQAAEDEIVGILADYGEDVV